MKFKITFKDPDGVFECLREAVKETMPEGLSEKEQSTLLESRIEDAKEKLKKWIEWGEYLTVEFDLEAETAAIVETT